MKYINKTQKKWLNLDQMLNKLNFKICFKNIKTLKINWINIVHLNLNRQINQKNV